MRRGPRSLATTASREQDFEENGQIKCICGFEEDDGFTIQCELCLVWQHASCVGIGKTNIPDKYYCEECAPASFSLHKQRTNGIKNFTQLDTLHVKDKEEVSAFICTLARSLQLAKSGSVSIYCPQSFESLKITFKRHDENSKSPKFSSKFYTRPIRHISRRDHFCVVLPERLALKVCLNLSSLFVAFKLLFFSSKILHW